MWADGPIPKELSNFPGYLMARLGMLSSRAFATALEPLGLHPKHFGVMNILANQAGMTQQRLTEHTGIDTSSMVAVIDELERRGFAERQPHPTDRRARTIYLTADGERMLKRARGVAANLQRDFFGVLTDAEQRKLVELLQKLAAGRVGAAAR
jgi:DNA-binding MarR family transcriptional regulator